MDVLLVEPWFGGSHRQWAEGFAAHSRHDVELLTLPDASWRWRMRGAALTLAARLTATPDVVLASSMLDLAGFLGHARTRLANVPTVLYMHENQLTYPLPDGGRRDQALALVNWTSMAVADAVAFNSEFHRTGWFEAITPMLRSYPAPCHDHMVDEIRMRSRVLPVGVDLSWVDTGPKPDPPLVLWNQRWEHDKRPEDAAAILAALADVSDIHIGICGENPAERTTSAFERLKRQHTQRIRHLGYAERSDYERLLNDASFVLSTAVHEFFGVAVVEAMAAGAVPIVPARLSYPEIVGADLSDLTYSDDQTAVTTVQRLLADPAEWARRSQAARVAAARFDWTRLAPQYDDLLSAVAPAS